MHQGKGKAIHLTLNVMIKSKEKQRLAPISI